MVDSIYGAASPGDRKTIEERKKKQIEQIETDLSREKKQYLRFGSKEKSLLDQLSVIEKKIDEKNRLLKAIQRKIYISELQIKKRQNRLKELERAAEKIQGNINYRCNGQFQR